MIKLKEISLLELIPQNLQEDTNIVAAAKAMDNELRELTNEIYSLPRYSRMDELTDEETDEMAWELHIDFYNPSLTIEQKRELVKNAIPWHRRKGTPSAVEELVATLFGAGKVQEWWEYGGQPFHFRVLTNNQDVTTSRAQEFTRAVNSVKRLTATLENVILSQAEQLTLFHGTAVHVGEHIKIR